MGAQPRTGVEQLHLGGQGRGMYLHNFIYRYMYVNIANMVVHMILQQMYNTASTSVIFCVCTYIYIYIYILYSHHEYSAQHI